MLQDIEVEPCRSAKVHTSNDSSYAPRRQIQTVRRREEWHLRENEANVTEYFWTVSGETAISFVITLQTVAFSSRSLRFKTEEIDGSTIRGPAICHEAAETDGVKHVSDPLWNRCSISSVPERVLGPCEE